MAFISAGARAETVLRGDVDGDGKIDVSDATMILRIAVRFVTPTSGQLLAGDVDPVPGEEGRLYGDGQLTVGDAIRILRYTVNLMDAAGFYAGEEPTLNLSDLILHVNTRPVQDLLYGSAAGIEAPLPILLLSDDPVSLGGFTLSITPLDGAPSLQIVRLERGSMLPEAVALLTNPSNLSMGTTRVRLSFSAAQLPPIRGHGEIFRLIVRSAAPLPDTAAYRINLHQTDFASELAETLSVPEVEKELSYAD